MSGILKKRRWTEQEDAFLREHYPTRGGRYCAKELGRNYGSMRQRAKALGLVSGYPDRGRRHAERIDEMLAKGMSRAAIARTLGVNIKLVRQRAERGGPVHEYREPTEEELDAMIEEQMRNLPAWWDRDTELELERQRQGRFGLPGERSED